MMLSKSEVHVAEIDAPSTRNNFHRFGQACINDVNLECMLRICIKRGTQEGMGELLRTSVCFKLPTQT